GWKSFTRSLVTTFKTTVADQIYKMFAQPFVVNIVGNLLGVTGGGSAMQTASGGSGGLMGMASNASSAYSLLTGGATGAAIASSLGSAAISLGNLIGSSAVTSFGAGMAGATLAPGLMGPTTIGATGAMGAGAGLGSTLAAIPGWGWALGGIGALFGGDIVSGLFGRKHEQRNLQGTFGGDTGFEGRWEDYYKGGLLRRSKSVYTALDETTRAGLGDQFSAMRSATVAMAETLGLGTAAISNFTASVNIKLKGLSAEDAQKKIQEEFDKIAESLAGTALGTDRYTRVGETSVQTLTRLATSLTGVNSAFESLGVTLYEASLAGGDMASQLVDLFGGLGQFSQATGAYMQNFYSAEEQRDVVRRQLERAFEGLDLKLPDIDASDARAQFRALAEAQDLTTEAGRRAWSVLVQLSGAFAGVTQSAQDAAAAAQDAAAAAQDAAEAAQRLAEQQRQQSFDAADDAYADLQRSVDARRAIVRETIDSTRAVFTTLRDNVRALYGEVGSTSLMQSAQGRAFIDQALAAAKTTGYLPDGDRLAEAINAVRAGMDGAAYASQFDADRDRLILAGKLNDLKAISGDQLTEAEKQLRALDGILDSARAQIDALKGIDTSVKSVEAAIKALEQALLAAGQLKQQQAMANLSGGVYHGNGTVTTGSGATVPVSEFVGQTDAARAGAYLASNPDVAAAYASGNTYGMTPAEFATVHYALYGVSEGRKFAKGGYYPGGVALVGEQGPELINFRNPGQVYTAAQTANLLGGGNTQRLEALVERLIDDNRRQAGEIARLNARMARVMEKWDGDGMPGAREEAAA
ncbi:MAG: hypothetical protein E7K47_09410, partial [Acidovorax sp.]|nr:hypothetical protein [Acidovorax sp.]